MKRGKLIILSGPSGVGKGTVRMALRARPELSLFYSVSLTTRPMRAGEAEGREYYFVTKEEFLRNVEENNFLEWNEFVGNYYGTPKDKVEEKLNEGKNVLLEIDVNGARKVMENCKDAVTIFLIPPSIEKLEERIRGRRTEEESIIQERLAKAESELAQAHLYKHTICNDKVEKAADEIAKIILA